jgi:hypothetical protein
MDGNWEEGRRDTSTLNLISLSTHQLTSPSLLGFMQRGLGVEDKTSSPSSTLNRALIVGMI